MMDALNLHKALEKKKILYLLKQGETPGHDWSTTHIKKNIYHMSMVVNWTCNYLSHMWHIYFYAQYSPFDPTFGSHERVDCFQSTGPAEGTIAPYQNRTEPSTTHMVHVHGQTTFDRRTLLTCYLRLTLDTGISPKRIIISEVNSHIWRTTGTHQYIFACNLKVCVETMFGLIKGRISTWYCGGNKFGST